MKDGFTWGTFGRSKTDSNLSEFFSSIRPSPGNPDSHYLLAGYYQERGQHREAISEFKKVLAIDPQYVKACNGLGVSYDLMGDYSSAIESYQAALALEPGHGYLHNNLGYSYLMQGNPDSAISAFQKAIALNPQESRFHNNLASAYAEKAQFQLAMEEFLRGGDETRAHFNMAEIYLQKGIYTEAQDHYVAALRLNPSYTLAQTGAKAAETLASIFGKSQNKMNALAGPVLPEPPKVEGSVAKEESSPAAMLQEGSVRPEKSLPHQTAAAQMIAGMDSSPISPETPVVRLASLETDGRDGKGGIPNQNFSQPGNSAGHASLSGNGSGSDEWDYEMKIALLSGKAVPIAPLGLTNSPKSASAKKSEIRRDIGIEISNGNGVNQMAKNVGFYLQKKGYQVGRLTNSQPFNHGHTRIYYQEGNGDIALQVADQLPTYYNLIELKKMDRPSIQVKILLGRDMIPHNKEFREKEGS